MPHEKINHPKPAHKNTQLVVSWNKIGWVQTSIYPEGWTNTGDALHVALPENELNLLIKTLKRAKRAAYSQKQRHTGFEDSTTKETTPLFVDTP